MSDILPSLPKGKAYGDPDGPDGGTVCNELHTEAHNTHDNCVNKTPHTVSAGPRLQEYNLLTQFLSKTQSTQPPSSFIHGFPSTITARQGLHSQG